MEEDKKEANEFREEATKAISTIAEQTTSNFRTRPSTVEAPQNIVGSSVFRRALARNKNAKK